MYLRYNTNLVTIALAAMAGGVILDKMNMLKDFLNGITFLAPVLKSLIGFGGATSAASGSLALAASVPSIFVKISAAITPLIPVIRELAAAFALLYGFYKVLYDIPYQKEIQHANDLKTAYESSTDTYRKNLKTIESLSARYYQLSKGVGDNGENISLTADEYKEYRGIIDSIARISPTLISSYTKEGAVLKSYTDVINDAKDAQKAYADESKRAYYESGSSQFKAWKEQYKDTKSDILSAWNDLGTSVYARGFGSLGKNQNIWRDALKSIGWDFDRDDLWGDVSDEILRSMYENSEVFVNTIASGLRNTGKYTENEIDGYINEIYEKVNAFKIAYSDTASIISEEAGFIFDKIRMDEENVIDTSVPIEAFDELRSGIESVIDPTKSYVDNLKYVNEYIFDFARIIGSDAGKNLTSMSEGLKTGEIDITQYNSALDLLKQEFGDNAAISAAIDYFESFTNIVRESGDQTGELTAQIKDLSSVLSGVSTSHSILEKARSDMEQYGSLQRETIRSMYDSLGSDEKGDIGKYIGISGDTVTFKEDEWLKRQIQAVSSINSSRLPTTGSSLCLSV